MAFIIPNLFQQTLGSQAGQSLISQRTANFNDYNVARSNEIDYLRNKQSFDQDLDFQYQFDALRQQGISPQQALFAIGQTANNPFVSANAYSQNRAVTELLAPAAAAGAAAGDFRLAAQLSDPYGANSFDTRARGANAIDQLLPLFGASGVNAVRDQAAADRGFALSQQARPTDQLLAQQAQAYQVQNQQLLNTLASLQAGPTQTPQAPPLVGAFSVPAAPAPRTPQQRAGANADLSGLGAGPGAFDLGRSSTLAPALRDAAGYNGPNLYTIGQYGG